MKLLLLVAFVFTVVSCESKEEISKRQEPTLDITEDNYNPVEMEATNPTGGINKGRLQKLSPEERLLRKQRNEALPIEWGTGAAGIGLLTTYAEAKDILANPLGVNGDVEFYPEGVNILWGNQDPKIPEIIVITDQYKGALRLPNEMMVTLGSSLGEFLAAENPTVPGALQFIGALLDGQDPLTYDCTAMQTCRLDADDEQLFFDFADGRWIWDIASGTLDLMYILPKRVLPAFVTSPFIYGEALGPITLATTKADAEKVLGPPVQVSTLGTHFYDDGNLGIVWQADDLPGLAFATSRFRGKVIITADPLLEKGIGDSLLDLAPADNQTIEGVARGLFASLENPNDDCVAAETCTLAPSGDLIEINLPRGFFLVDPANNFSLEFFGMAR